MHSSIRFLRLNRYRHPIGSIDSTMGYGVHDALVMRGIAEWVERPIVASGISEPVAVSKEAPKRARTSRRIDSTEE